MAVLIVINSILKRGFDNQSVSNGWEKLPVNKNSKLERTKIRSLISYCSSDMSCIVSTARD